MPSLEELRRENTELRTKLAQLEHVVSVVESASEAILSTATDGTILSWNRAAERLYGFTPGEAVGRCDLELVPFDRLAEHQQAVARALRGEAVMIDTRRRRREGRTVEVTILYIGLVDPSGKPIGVALISHARG
jgi:PAS domain S-box-containing protein